MHNTCTVFPRALVEPYHAHLNNIDPIIQFTVERETEGQLPFLDVLLTREGGGSINTLVFQKATHRPVLGLRISPSNSPQGSSSQNTDCTDRDNILLWCDPGSVRRVCVAVTLEKGYPAMFIKRHSLCYILILSVLHVAYFPFLFLFMLHCISARSTGMHVRRKH